MSCTTHPAGYVAGCATCQRNVAVEALDDIAAWDEGPVVKGSFDEPASAARARLALQKIRGGNGHP